MRILLPTFLALIPARSAFASEPTNGGIGFQPAATELARDAFGFHNIVLMPIITLITLVVMGLLLYVMLRFNKRANKTPSKATHNTFVEVVWTVIPVIILVVIAGFSFPLLYKFDKEPDLAAIASGDGPPDARAAAEAGWVSVKAQGNQWNWTYTYPDLIDADGYPIEFVSNPIHLGLSTDTDDGLRNLSVDYPMVVPAGRYIRYYTAASDVIHSFAMPAFGIKTDAIPGRSNEGWFKVDQPGVYYGQCSELCGVNHAYMPIEVRVVPQQQFDAWVAVMKAGDVDAGARLVAEVQQPEGDTQVAAVN